MVSPFQAAVQAAQDVITAFAGESITYHRGAQQVTLTATVGQTDFENLEESARLVRMESRDFLFDAADLELGGLETHPEPGDRIRQTIAGAIHLFDVFAPDGVDCWRWSDRSHKQLRVHTTYIGTE